MQSEGNNQLQCATIKVFREMYSSQLQSTSIQNIHVVFLPCMFDKGANGKIHKSLKNGSKRKISLRCTTIVLPLKYIFFSLSYINLAFFVYTELTKWSFTLFSVSDL